MKREILLSWSALLKKQDMLRHLAQAARAAGANPSLKLLKASRMGPWAALSTAGAGTGFLPSQAILFYDSVKPGGKKDFSGLMSVLNWK